MDSVAERLQNMDNKIEGLAELRRLLASSEPVSFIGRQEQGTVHVEANVRLPWSVRSLPIHLLCSED